MSEDKVQEKTITEEPKELTETEFLELAVVIREKIKNADNLKPEGKSATLLVFDAVVRSVKAHGISQHGITKKKKQMAMAVFQRMSNAEHIAPEEKTVLEMLVYVTYQGIVQAK